MLEQFVIGLVVGAVGCLFYIAKKKSTNKSSNNDVMNGKIIFLNVLILDKSAAVQSAVEEKVQGKLGSGYLRNKLGQKLGALANKVVSDEKIADKMSAKLVEELPLKLADVGLMVTARKVFQQDAFFVTQINVISADLHKLIAVKDESKANTFDEVIKVLGGDWVKNSLETTALPMVCEKLQDILPAKLKEKLDDKGLECDIFVKSEADQATYFFEAVGDLR